MTVRWARDGVCRPDSEPRLLPLVSPLPRGLLPLASLLESQLSIPATGGRLVRQLFCPGAHLHPSIAHHAAQNSRHFFTTPPTSGWAPGRRALSAISGSQHRALPARGLPSVGGGPARGLLAGLPAVSTGRAGPAPTCPVPAWPECVRQHLPPVGQRA